MSVRPSELLNVSEHHGDWVAYCLDEAIFYVGRYIENELEQVKLGKGQNAARTRAAKQERLLQKLLGTDGAAGKRFADPADMFKKQ